MPFEEGQTKKGGRSKGTPNETTKAIRESFSLLVSNNLSKLQEDLDLMKPVDRVKAITDLAKFCVPTLKAVEIEDLTPKEVAPVQIVFTRKTNDEAD